MKNVSIAFALILLLATANGNLQGRPDSKIFTIPQNDKTAQYDSYANSVSVDDQIAWLEDNTFPISTLKFSKKKFKDLEPLKEKIGDTRIVMLGEESHGHGTSFLLKSRLVKFLHEEMGFSVILWESNMFDCRLMDEAMQDKKASYTEAADLGIYSVWARSEQLQPLLKYIKNVRNSENPLITAGFDMQFDSVPDLIPFDYLNFIGYLDNLFNSPESNLLDQSKLDELVDYLSRGLINLGIPDLESCKILVKDLKTLHKKSRSKLKKVYSSLERKYQRQLLANLEEYINALLAASASSEPEWTYNDYRDNAMAKCLLFLLNKYYKDRKIIVWGATYHLMRNMDKIYSLAGDQYYPVQITMGHWLKEKLKEDVYLIAPISYQGTAEWWNDFDQFDIELPPEGSLTWMLHELGKKYIFLDLKSVPQNHWLRERQICRPIYSTSWSAVWPDIVDAFVYLESSSPSMERKAQGNQTVYLQR